MTATVRWTLAFVEGPFDGLSGWQNFAPDERPPSSLRVRADDDGEPHIYAPDVFHIIPGDSALYELVERTVSHRAAYRFADQAADQDAPVERELVEA